MAQNGKATTIKKTFSRETSVSVDINSKTDIIWELLTDAQAYPDWNSTIISIDGKIEQGEKIRLKSKLNPKKIFKLKVKVFEPHKKLVWGDGKGERVYRLDEIECGTRFTMNEKIGGLMFPMYAKYIPPFDNSFEAFADDLKTRAEGIQENLEE